jgi:hypothetical protein
VIYFYSGIGVIIFFYLLLALVVVIIDDEYCHEECLVCGDRFRDKSVLNNHYSTIHPDFCKEWANW